MLRIYSVVLELVRELGPVIGVVRARSAALGDQMERALISVPLNIAEGDYSRGRNQQARFQFAAGSARETLACLETAEALGFLASSPRIRSRKSAPEIRSRNPLPPLKTPPTAPPLAHSADSPRRP